MSRGKENRMTDSNAANLASQTYPDTCGLNVVAPKSQENVNLSYIIVTSAVSVILEILCVYGYSTINR